MTSNSSHLTSKFIKTSTKVQKVRKLTWSLHKSKATSTKNTQGTGTEENLSSLVDELVSKKCTGRYLVIIYIKRIGNTLRFWTSAKKVITTVIKQIRLWVILITCADRFVKVKNIHVTYCVLYTHVSTLLHILYLDS